MLTIDDPELERFIREEAARTGEEPAAVLRRILGVARVDNETGVVRNGIRLFPVRPGAGIVTHDLIRRLLDEGA